MKRVKTLLSVLVLLLVIGLCPVSAQEVEPKAPPITTLYYYKTATIGSNTIRIRITCNETNNAGKTTITYKRESAIITSSTNSGARIVGEFTNGAAGNTNPNGELVVVISYKMTPSSTTRDMNFVIKGDKLIN